MKAEPWKEQPALFGYIKPYQPELKIKELDAYKAVYCGLCGQLGRSFGPAARLALSYDFTFLAMLGFSVSGAKPEVKRRSCYVNPFVKRVICVGGEPLAFASDCAAILIYYKLMDNIRDEPFFKTLFWQLLRPFAALAKRKAAKARPEVEGLIAENLRKQKELEDAKCASLDAASEPMAAILAGLFRMQSEDEIQRRVLERLGYLIGRYIYISDALDDLGDDRKSGSYNPFAIKYSVKGGDDPAAREAEAKATAEAEASLNMTIGEAEKTRALLTLGDFSPVIDNILTMGLRAGTLEILAKKERTR